jgi:hypothetical protein
LKENERNYYEEPFVAFIWLMPLYPDAIYLPSVTVGESSVLPYELLLQMEISPPTIKKVTPTY